MRRQLKNACAALLVSFAITYALGSYIAWDLNPADWTQDGRIINAVVAAVICVLMLVLLGLGRRRRDV